MTGPRQPPVQQQAAAVAAQCYPRSAILNPLLLCHSCLQMDAPAAALPAAL
jgi:hypothetical protein